ncbi:MAG: NADH-quinone oxidoreductase subunit NuoF [Deltaproteobacteria bacterium]|nr:NADH-quinone oxidoreductase subunit NuoF [Deltaproteobacteria bacterium]
MIIIGAATCGRAAGAGELFGVAEEELSRLGIKAEIIPTGCIGICHAEPLVDIKLKGQPRVCYHHVTPKKLKKIIRQHVAKGKPVLDFALGTIGNGNLPGLEPMFELPVFKPQVRRVLRNCGIINPDSLDHYLARDGYLGLKKAFEIGPEAVIAEVEKSGLRGRGGGGFPTGLKWKFCRSSKGDEKYLICNADEGDPGAFMDRSVLEGDPHSVLEGMCIAAFAIGASHGYVYIRAEYPLAIEKLKAAMADMHKVGLLGENILDSGFSFDITIKQGAGAFVCGEETALIASIEGKRGMPRPRPPFPAVEGLFGKPTNINNVETLANVANILRQGADWFASVGTEKSKGTKTFALAGKINRPGLIEVPMGITLGEVVEQIGGGIPGGKKFKAAQTGGPSGGCLPSRFLDSPIDYENLAKAGSIMGSGGLVVMDENTCMVDLARYFLTFTQSESCGKCTPCRVGTKEMLSILERICAGDGQPGDIELLEELGRSIKNASLCGLGQTAPNPVLTTIKYFREEYEEHIHDKHCRAAVCKGMVEAPCHHSCPAGVKAHRYVREISQGNFANAYLVVRENMPLPSVCGLVCFHPCETHCRRGSLDEPIAIRALKGSAVKYGARAEPQNPVVAQKSGKSVAVVGSGPAGLTAAYYLAKKGGHKVTVFEALKKPGGMLRTGIPRYRLPEKDLERDIKIIKRVGVRIKTGKRIESLSELKKNGFDATFIATGAYGSRNLGVPGERSKGVIDCVQFLLDVNMGRKNPEIGPRVAVVGGGNSAIDAARTALRVGAREVTILYRRSRAQMPADPQEISDAIEEGIDLQTLVLPVQVKRTKAGLNVTCKRMRLGNVDSSGRRRPVPIDGSEHVLQFDTVISAIGQYPDIPSRFRLELGKGNIITVDMDTMETSVTGVFAGGDATSGPASVVEAIAAGRKAAQAIDRFLGGDGDIEERFAPVEDVSKLPPLSVGTGAGVRPGMPHTSTARRIKDFTQVEKGYSKKDAIAEAGRCLRCDLEN